MGALGMCVGASVDICREDLGGAGPGILFRLVNGVGEIDVYQLKHLWCVVVEDATCRTLAACCLYEAVPA